MSGTLATGGYAVVTVPAVATPNGVARYLFAGTSSQLQNGPDVVALLDTTQNALVDAVVYGSGALMTPAVTPTGGAPIPLGNASTIGPDGIGDSLARFPNGCDRDSVADWGTTTTLTAGAANSL